MKEVFKQSEGIGLIDIKGDADSAVFFHKKEPRVVAWEMDYNTLFDFFAGNLPDKQLFSLQEYDHLVHTLEQGLLPSQNLVKVLKPFLRLLPNARYEIELVTYSHKHFIVRAGLDQETHFKNGKALKTILTYQYHAGCDFLYVYATQRFLDRNRVSYYESIIRQGKEPLPILLRVKEGVIKFILDGHHKMQAYINLGKPIKAIQIAKVDHTTISDAQFEQIAKGFSQELELLKSLEYLRRE